MNEDELFEIGVLEICQRLHMSFTGTSDPLQDDIKEAYRNYLRKRQNNWKPSMGKTFEYDTYVYALMSIAIEH